MAGDMWIFKKFRKKHNIPSELIRYLANGGEIDFSNHEEVQTTRCDECGRQFLFITTTDEAKRPFICDCGNKLTWSIPYTRIEVESDEKIDYINLLHQKGWYRKLAYIVNTELDGQIKFISIKK